MDKDQELELRINAATSELAEAVTEDAQRAAWRLLKSLLCQRSPERVAQMERERGLR